MNIQEVSNFELGTNSSSVPEMKQNKHTCPKCSNTYASVSSLNKHIKKNKCGNNSNELQRQFDKGLDKTEQKAVEKINNDSETESLQQELLALYLNNPRIVKLDQPVNLGQIELIKNMTADELKMRIMEIKQNLSTKMDRRFADTLVSASSVLIGSILGCGEELEEVNRQDELLCESTQELLSFRLGLFALPPEVKVSGLFAVNTVDVFTRKLKENRRKQLEELELERQRQVDETPVHSTTAPDNEVMDDTETEEVQKEIIKEINAFGFI